MADLQCPGLGPAGRTVGSAASRACRRAYVRALSRWSAVRERLLAATRGGVGTAPRLRCSFMVAALSPSRAADFMQCPLLYRFRVIDRCPRRPARRRPGARWSTRCSSGSSTCLPPSAPSSAAHAMLAAAVGGLLEAEPELAVLFPATTPRRWRLAGVGRETLVERWFSLEDPTGSSRPSASCTSRPTWTTAGPARLRRPARRRARPARCGWSTTRPGRSPPSCSRRKALFQMRFYALVLWRLRGVVPRHAAAGVPRQRRDRRLRPRRGASCWRPSASSARCGRPSSGPPITGDWRPAPEPAVRLVRPPRALPRVGRHAAAAARRRGPARAQPAVVSRGRPCGGLTRAVPEGSTALVAARAGHGMASLGHWTRQPADGRRLARPPRILPEMSAIRPVDVSSLRLARPVESNTCSRCGRMRWQARTSPRSPPRCSRSASRTCWARTSRRPRRWSRPRRR